MTNSTNGGDKPPSSGMAVLLRAARHHADLSQRELAERAGVDRGMVSRIESGAVDSPRMSTVVRLLQAADVSLVPVTGKGEPLAPRPHEDALDAAARHWPAHLEVREVRTWLDWWFSRMILDGRPLPTHTADWRRNQGRPRRRRKKHERDPPMTPGGTVS